MPRSPRSACASAYVSASTWPSTPSCGRRPCARRARRRVRSVGVSPRPIASITDSGTPCSRAIGTCAHHSNSAFQRAPVGDDRELEQATFDRRCRSGDAHRGRRPAVRRSGACSHGLNGPRKPSALVDDARTTGWRRSGPRGPAPESSRSSRRSGRKSAHVPIIAKARTGNVPKPLTFGGTAKNRAPRSGSWSRWVRCSTIGTPAPSRP